MVVDGSTDTDNKYVVKQRLVSSVLGMVSRVNKLVSVEPIETLYKGQVGDLVVGTVKSVQSGRWKVALNSCHQANLLLSSVSLPDGVQRVRNKEDSLNMRSLFSEGDVLTGEVQSVMADGVINVHARSARYGKLRNGVLVSVPQCLVRRGKTHNFALSTLTPIDVLLGCNGKIWVQRHVNLDRDEVVTVEDIESEKQAHAETPCTEEERLDILRVRNSIEALATVFRYVDRQTIQDVYDSSRNLGIDVNEMTERSCAVRCTECTRAKGKRKDADR